MHKKTRRRRRSVIDGPVACAIERLEGRLFLSLSPIGGEFLVNTFTTSEQSTPAIAADADGDFVVAWLSYGQDGSNYGIFAQRYNAAGVAQGIEFQVNTFTTGSQRFVAAAMDADGDFVIAWDSPNQDGSSTGIYAKRYNSAGVVQGVEFRVNTHTTGEQLLPAVAMSATGDFIVAWQGAGSGDTYGIFAQRYNAAGAAQGGQFLVNTYTTNSQRNHSIALDADGDFVITWSGYGTGDTSGVFAQRFNALGIAQGSEFIVNTVTAGSQSAPAIGLDASGDFVVSWTGSYDIFAQRYNAAGVAQGSEFRVNTYTNGFQAGAAMAMDADGDFLIAWTDGFATGQDGSSLGVYAQEFNSSGVAQGIEFRVNTVTTNGQSNPAVTMDANGNAIVAWQSNTQDGSVNGVYAQRYAMAPFVEGVFVNGNSAAAYSAVRGPIAQLVVSFSQNMSTAGGTSGPTSVTNPANWLLVCDDAVVTPVNITFGFNGTTNRYEATLTLPESYIRGSFQLKVRDSMTDVAGDALDGDKNGVAGGIFLRAFSVTRDLTPGAAFQINSNTLSDSRSIGSVLMDDLGNATVSWINTSFGFPTGSSSGSAQRVNADGTLSGGSFGFPLERTVAMDSTGNYVVARLLKNPGLFEPIYGVGFQRYNASNVAQGGQVDAHQITGTFTSVSVDMDSAGNFVIAWTQGDEITARRFNATGAAQGNEFHVNTSTTGSQGQPRVIVDEEGDFVIAWTSDHTGAGEVYAQRYSAAGAAQGGEFRIDDASHPANPATASLAIDSDGDFVAVWMGVADSEVYGRRFDRFGIAQGNSFLINSYTTGTQGSAAVVMDDAGDFLVAWNGPNKSGSGYGVYARIYGRDGIGLAEFAIAEGAILPTTTMAMNDSGDLVVFGFAASIFGNEITSVIRLTPLTVTPTVGTLTDSPEPVTRGSALALTAGAITGPNAAASVSFYRESNGLPGLQSGPEGDTFVSTDTTSGDGWTAAAPTLSLAPGTYTYYAQAIDGGGLAGTPASTTNTVIAGSRPLVINAVFQYDTLPRKLMFTFDRFVTGVSIAGDLDVDRLPGTQLSSSEFTMLPYGTDGTNVVTFVFNSPPIEGNYTATLGPTIFDPISGLTMASPFVLNFFLANGDVNHDRKVDARDLLILANNWLASGKTWSQGDFTGDGIVDQQDLTVMAQSWQQGIPAPAPPLPSAPVPTVARAAVRPGVRTPIRPTTVVQDVLA